MGSDRARLYYRKASSVERALATVQRALDLGYVNVAARLMDEIRRPYETLWALASFSPYLVDSARAWGLSIEKMELRVQAALAGQNVPAVRLDCQP